MIIPIYHKYPSDTSKKLICLCFDENIANEIKEALDHVNKEKYPQYGDKIFIENSIEVLGAEAYT
jgi:hypothetical protein